MGTSSQSIHPFLPPQTHRKGSNRCKYIVANNIHFFCHGKPSPTNPAAILSLRKPHWHRLPNLERQTSETRCRLLSCLPPPPLGCKNIPDGLTIYDSFPNI